MFIYLHKNLAIVSLNRALNLRSDTANSTGKA